MDIAPMGRARRTGTAPLPLRPCYAVSGTNAGYGATRYSVRHPVRSRGAGGYGWSRTWGMRLCRSWY
eukprot:3723397-Rhodomonas_salina.2